MKFILLILITLVAAPWLSSCTSAQADRIENRYDRREDRVERYQRLPGRRGAWY
jgi:hypothetical protein